MPFELEAEQSLLTHVFAGGIDDEVSYRIEDLATPEDYWTLRDDLGSVTSLTNAGGAVVERYEHGDYGSMRIFDAAGAGRPSSGYSLFHGYTGRPAVAGTELIDSRHRVLDPETGTFGQRDPLGAIDSMNLYAYVVLNPFAFTDPYGLSIWSDAWEITKAFGEGAKDGAMGVTDGIVPFYDPFKDNGFYDPCDEQLAISRKMGVVAREALLAAAGAQIGKALAGAPGKGKEFSHFIPKRMGGPRSIWNGNYVTTAKHALSDPHRCRFMPSTWKQANPMPSKAVQLYGTECPIHGKVRGAAPLLGRLTNISN